MYESFLLKPNLNQFIDVLLMGKVEVLHFDALVSAVKKAAPRMAESVPGLRQPMSILANALCRRLKLLFFGVSHDLCCETIGLLFRERADGIGGRRDGKEDERI